MTKAEIDSFLVLANPAEIRSAIGKRMEKYNPEDKDSPDRVHIPSATGAIYSFFKEIKIGDVVIIPSKRSEKIMIGIVESEVYSEDNISHLEGVCQYDLRRRVNWGNIEYQREKLNPHLQMLFSTRLAVANINRYAEYIDTNINDFYVKGDETFLVLNVKTENSIAATDLGAIFQLLPIIDEFYKEQDESHFSVSKEIKMKVQLESPGSILLSIALYSEVLFVFGCLVLLLNGGEFKVEKLNLSLSTKGIISKISEFLDRKKDRELTDELIKKINNLDIENPEDLIKLIEKIKNTRDSY